MSNSLIGAMYEMPDGSVEIGFTFPEGEPGELHIKQDGGSIIPGSAQDRAAEYFVGFCKLEEILDPAELAQIAEFAAASGYPPGA